MTAAALSLVALIVALALSMSSRINVGWLALAFAWLGPHRPAHANDRTVARTGTSGGDKMVGR